MKIKPLIFNIYAALFLIIACSIPVQIGLLYNHGITELNAIFNKMTIFNILVIATCAYNFYYCMKASDNVKWSFPLSIGVVCLNNSIVLVYGNDFESYSVILSTVMFISTTAYFLLSHETDVINHPENHWWRVPERKAIQQPISTKVNDEVQELGMTHDLSVGGAFIPIKLEDQYQMFKSGEVIELLIGDKNPIQCKAKIVRKVSARGQYPDGVGVQFMDLSLTDKVRLRQILFANRLALVA